MITNISKILLITTILLSSAQHTFALKQSYIINNNSSCDIYKTKWIGLGLFKIMSDDELNGPYAIDKYSSAIVHININEYDYDNKPTPSKVGGYKIYCNNEGIFGTIEPATGHITFKYRPETKDIMTRLIQFTYGLLDSPADITMTRS